MQVSAEPALPVEGRLPPLTGAVEWLNSPPLTADALRGKVVLIDVWTYSCINCLRTLPYVKAWAQKYRDQGLVVIGVHAPEFAFERNVDNVRKATHDLGIDYPVAIDNNFAIWRALNNQYWPAHYFVDAQGQIRHHHFGEGEYAESERVIQQLLVEAGHASAANVATGLTKAGAQGVQLAADGADMRSPETYVGYQRAENFASPGGQTRDQVHDYAAPKRLAVNDWGLAGEWKVGGERATLAATQGRIVYRFHARDLHLVLGPTPGRQAGALSREHRRRRAGRGARHRRRGRRQRHGDRRAALPTRAPDRRDRGSYVLSIEFLDAGVEAYAFTFG